MTAEKKYLIVTWAFGSPSSLPSNRRLANIALKKARQLKASIYTQYDVPIDIEEGEEKVAVKYLRGKNPPTLRLARAAVKWALEEGLTDIVVVAAEPHVMRCCRDLHDALREAKASLVIHIASEVYSYSKEEWFCPQSEQARTRSEQQWEFRELLLSHMPKALYKRLSE